MMTAPREIVFVEDSIDDADLTRHALRRARVANPVRHVRDGAAAIELLCSDADDRPRPAMVLLDLKLPKVSGLEVLERLKSDPRTQSLPVVVLTSSREDRDVQEAYRLGANSYIVKPVEFGAFTKAVGEVTLYWLTSNVPPCCA